MNPKTFGAEGITEADRIYKGSRFSEMREALFANPYQKVWGSPGEPPFPRRDVNLLSVLRGMWPFAMSYLLYQASKRTIDSKADLRWGSDRKGFRRIIHPNGICLIGKWEITTDTGYSGYFRKGSQALVIGRYSTCCAETRRGHIRSLSLVGKLFPTLDPKYTGHLQTANFFTQQDLGGEKTDYINDVETRNAPNTHAWRRGTGVLTLLAEGILFMLADKQPTMRQLYPIAELGKQNGEPTRSPTFMRLLMAPDQPRIPGEALDFRDEIMSQIYDEGDESPKRDLKFDIEITDEGSTQGPPVFQRRTFKNWRQIGTLTFNEAVASYNGDFVIHFSHPTWREDQNEGATATRINGRKMWAFWKGTSTSRAEKKGSGADV
jgi:hypothetical protein